MSLSAGAGACRHARHVGAGLRRRLHRQSDRRDDRPYVSQELRLQTIAHYGLDRPLWEQYLTFLGRVLHGDFGRSFVFEMPVMDLIRRACRRRWN